MNYFDYYILFCICVIGLCMGSFYNVVILRSVSGESIVLPPSKCPKCGNKLKPWHNIPVLSYIFLRGKCAFCHEKISIQYPIVELLTMFLFAASFLKFGMDIKTIASIIICSVLIIMTGTDIKEQKVDCRIAIALGIGGLIYNFLFTGNIIGAILGLIVGIAIMEGIAWSGKLIAGERAFGEADTYVAAALGACFGMRGLLFVLMYALVAAMIYVVPVFLYKQYKAGNNIICVLSILFIISVLIFKTLLQNWYTYAFLGITGLFLVYELLKNIKNSEKFNYFPFVPAIAIGALYYLLF